MRVLGLGLLGALAFAASCGDTTQAPRGAAAAAGAGGVDAAAGAANEEPSSAGVPSTGQAGGGGQIGDSAGAPTAAGEAGMAAVLDGAVHGRVQFGREPVVGMLVVLDETTSTKTAADGSFTFVSAPATYRLAFIDPPSMAAFVFDDLHGREPLIRLGGRFGKNRTAGVHGKLSGATGTASQFLWVGFRSDTHGWLDRAIMPGDSGVYGITPFWNGAATQNGKLFALSFETETGDVGAALKSYIGYAEQALSVSEGDMLGVPDGSNATDIELSPVTEQGLLAGNVTLPAGYVIGGASGLDVGPFQLQLNELSKSGGSYSCLVPRVPNLPVAVHFTASKTIGGHGASFMARAVPATGALDFDLPASPLGVAPVNGSSGVTTSTTFSWTAMPPEMVMTVRFHIDSWFVWRMTSGTSTTIPDLTAYGVPFPKSETSYWSLEGVGPASDVDQAATIDYGNLGLSGPEYVNTFTDDLTFITAD